MVSERHTFHPPKMLTMLFEDDNRVVAIKKSMCCIEVQEIGGSKQRQLKKSNEVVKFSIKQQTISSINLVCFYTIKFCGHKVVVGVSIN